MTKTSSKNSGSKKGSQGKTRGRDDVLAIILIAGGFLLAISVLSQALGTQSAGIMGRYGDLGLRYAIGVGRFLLPFALLAWGALIALKGHQTKIPITGIAMVLAGFVVAVQLSAPDDSFFHHATVASHGGYFGAIIGWPLMKLVGTIGAYIVVISVATIGLVLATGFSFSSKVQDWYANREAEADRREAAKKRAQARGKTVPKGSRKLPEEKTSTKKSPDVFDLPTTVEDQAEIVDSAVEPKAKASVAKGDGEKEKTAKQLDSAISHIEGDDYKLPPLSMFEAGPPASEVSKKDLNESIGILQTTLADFDIEAKVNRVIKGPTVTRFELTLGSGIKVSKVSGLSDNLAMALAAPEIRILAPIPGQAAVGIEVPNKKKDLVSLGGIMRSDEAQSQTSPIGFAVGKDIAGRPIFSNLTQMPHLLVAGATGSGKSVMVNSLIISLISRARPSQVRLILIDPKKVELNQYNGLPHLLTPVITQAKRASNALAWAVGQMEERYEALAAAGVRNIDGYNEWLKKEEPDSPPMPYIVIIIDELADLMMAAAKDVEDAICRITQMARACGMHLVVATQRPSVDVITGLIKANIPSRIAFAVTSMADSRVILDQGGADKLLGKGDMLFMNPASLRPERVQGAFVSDSEVEKITDFLKAQGEPEYQPEIVLDPRSEAGDVQLADPLFEEAVEIVFSTKQASVSYLQRRLSVGYTRAGRLMDMLEGRGIVGGYEGSKPRALLITRGEWEHMNSSSFER